MSSSKPILVAGERSLDAQQLFAQGASIAAKLEQAGLQEGDAIALILRNDFAYFIMHDAARYAAFDIVPVNWHLNATEIDYILNDCSARAVVVHEDLVDDTLRAVLQERLVLVVATPPEVLEAYQLDPGHAADPDFQSWDQWVKAKAKPNRTPVPFCPPLFYTSGTSGRPKAVVREKIAAKLLAKVAERTRFAWGFDKTPVCSVMTGPLYHSAPNGYANMVLQAQGTLILQPRFDAEELLMLIDKHEISHLHMVPTMFNRLLALPENIRNKYSLKSLVHVSHGAAPCPPEVKRQMIDWWGPVIYEYYAMTETGIICCSSSEGWLAHPGSVGSAAPGVSLQIRHDDGSPCSTGETGLICVQHEATSAVSYHKANEKSAELVQDGYLVTGDIGYLDDDGFLYISDRKSDMVISGGVNIYPAEIESELITMPGVKDCIVFGIPDKEFGEKLVAFIESDGQLEVNAIKAFLKTRIASFKVPKIFEQVSSLPREDSGKLKKREIREQYLNNM